MKGQLITLFKLLKLLKNQGQLDFRMEGWKIDGD